MLSQTHWNKTKRQRSSTISTFASFSPISLNGQYFLFQISLFHFIFSCLQPFCRLLYVWKFSILYISRTITLFFKSLYPSVFFLCVYFFLSDWISNLAMCLCVREGVCMCVCSLYRESYCHRPWGNESWGYYSVCLCVSASLFVCFTSATASWSWPRM